jgi:hypothetical protein
MHDPRTPKWERDLRAHIETVPYGDINVQVKRVNHKTVEITTVAQETLRYVDNQEALRDMARLIENLATASFTGELELKVKMVNGEIRLLGIFDKKQTAYH